MTNNKMTRTLMAITAAFALTGTASAAAIYAAWDLNEGSGTTTTQYQRGTETWNQVENPEANLAATASEDFSTTSGLSWDATSSGAPGSTASLLFNGNNARNTLNTSVSGSGLDGTGAKTFVAWINPTAGNGTIISYSPKGGSVNGADLRFLIDGNGNLRGEVSGGFFVNNTVDLRNDGWNMVAAIFDGNTNTSTFYLGGTGILGRTSVGARAIETNASGNAGDFSNPNIIIGSNQAGVSFTGGIDMAAVYTGALTGALTEAELDSIFTSGVAIPEPGTLALVGIALGSLLFLRRRR